MSDYTKPSLLNIPAEIRMKIFKLSLADTKVTITNRFVHGWSTNFRRETVIEPQPGILRVCRLVRDEAVEAFGASIKFLAIDSPACTCPRCPVPFSANSIKETHRHYLRNIEDLELKSFSPYLIQPLKGSDLPSLARVTLHEKYVRDRKEGLESSFEDLKAGGFDNSLISDEHSMIISSLSVATPKRKESLDELLGPECPYQVVVKMDRLTTFTRPRPALQYLLRLEFDLGTKKILTRRGLNTSLQLFSRADRLDVDTNAPLRALPSEEAMQEL